MDKNNIIKQEQSKKQRNILSYAVIMIICVIIIILFAAMADNRENEIDNRIYQTEQANANIQNELVTLQNENDKLVKEAQEKDALISGYENSENRLSQLSQIWGLIESGDTQAASDAASALDVTEFGENEIAYYNALCELLKIEPAENQTADDTQ